MDATRVASNPIIPSFGRESHASLRRRQHARVRVARVREPDDELFARGELVSADVSRAVDRAKPRTVGVEIGKFERVAREVVELEREVDDDVLLARDDARRRALRGRRGRRASVARVAGLARWRAARTVTTTPSREARSSMSSSRRGRSRRRIIDQSSSSFRRARQSSTRSCPRHRASPATHATLARRPRRRHRARRRRNPRARRRASSRARITSSSTSRSSSTTSRATRSNFPTSTPTVRGFARSTARDTSADTSSPWVNNSSSDSRTSETRTRACWRRRRDVYDSRPNDRSMDWIRCGALASIAACDA